jgi:hypothetical protein
MLNFCGREKRYSILEFELDRLKREGKTMTKPSLSHSITELHAEILDLRAMLSRTIPILQATASGHETRMASGDLLNSVRTYFSHLQPEHKM